MNHTRWVTVVFTTGWLSISAFAAELAPAQQNALVGKYCAVCHTDAARNGGLSLEHYDAAQPNPALAAMILSKLQTGAMGAAGLGSPDKITGDAWIEKTSEQARGAHEWTVIRGEAAPNGAVTASIVRDVPPRLPGAVAPLYRLTVTCGGDHRGEMQLAWSPQPQTDRTFTIAVDGGKEVPQTLQGRETMGNGTSMTSGRAAAALSVPLPEKTLTVRELFPGENVTFSVADLPKQARADLRACFR